MIQTISQVVENHICTNCGTCVGVCPAGALEMVETLGGEMLPQLNSERCTDCGLCHSVCPQINIPARMKEHLVNPCVGPVRRGFLGEVLDPGIAAAGQTGGVGRTLLASALEFGLCGAAVCVMDNPKKPLRPLAMIVRTPKEVFKSSRSKYCPIPVNALIDEMVKSDVQIAFLGLGCHMQGLHLAMENLPKLRDWITLKIGLFCDRVMTYAAADHLIRCAGMVPQNVASFDYKHKACGGWPGDIRIVTSDGSVRNVSRYRRLDALEFFTPIHCRLCIDKLNVLSDVSLGDPWGVAKGKQVPTAAIVRTRVGEKVLLEAQKAAKINLAPVEAEAVIRGQNIASRMDNCIKFRQEMTHRGYELPTFLRTGPMGVERKGSRPLLVRWAVGFTIFSNTTKGTRAITRIPPWLLALWGAPKRWYRRWRFRFVHLMKSAMGLCSETLHVGKKADKFKSM